VGEVSKLLAARLRRVDADFGRDGVRGRDVITITRCDRYTDSNTEWVTKMTVLRKLRHNASRSSLSRNRVISSSAAKRLVHQQDLWVGDQRAAPARPHLHAAGQFARIGVGEFGKPYLSQCLVDACVGLFCRRMRPISTAAAHSPARWSTAIRVGS